MTSKGCIKEPKGNSGQPGSPSASSSRAHRVTSSAGELDYSTIEVTTPSKAEVTSTLKSRKAGEAMVQRTRTPREKAIVSPLRYPGSKRRLTAFIEDTLARNHLRPALFVEPFAGGASTSLRLLQKGLVDTIGLIDADPLVGAFWQTVFFDAAWLVDQLMTVEISVANWRRFKALKPNTRREKALACIYLNRTSFSGILAPGAGPIGGYEQTSEYTIDCRFPREELARRICQAASYRDQVAFVWSTTWSDGMALINLMRVKGTLPDETFYYFDPPFFEKADRLYTHYFHDHDHRWLRDALAVLRDPWILSYDPASQVEELYGTMRQGPAHIELLYSAAQNAGNRVAKEVVLSNLHIAPANILLWKKQGRNGHKVSKTATASG